MFPSNICKQSGWAKKNHKNLKFIWYEEMKKDHRKILNELSNFLGYPLTKEQIDTLLEHLTIDSMRKVSTDQAHNEVNKQINQKFFRKGKVGDWKNHMTEEKLKVWNKWIEDNTKGTDIKMNFE